MATTHHIRIRVHNVAEPGEVPDWRFIAKPAVLHVDSTIEGHKVQWHNEHGGKAKLWFKDADKVFHNTDIAHSVDIAAAGHLLDVTDSPTVGTYDYQVYCHATAPDGTVIRGFAQGNSDPRIMVD